MSAAARLARFGQYAELVPNLAALPPAQTDLWPRLADVPEPFVLYGGTALALRFGHRQSVDFDFFAADAFAPNDLLRELRWLGRVEIVRTEGNSLVVVEPGGVQLAFYGGLDLQAVAEPSVDRATGLVVASIYDLAGTKAKAILDRSEWRDYVDIATLLRAGHRLADVIGYAAAIFDRSFAFPVAQFLQALVWFADGTAPDVPADIRRELEQAVHDLDLADIPRVEPHRPTIAP